MSRGRMMRLRRYRGCRKFPAVLIFLLDSQKRAIKVCDGPLSVDPGVHRGGMACVLCDLNQLH